MLPHVRIISTGGTILSEGAHDDQLDGYALSGLSAESLLAGLPSLQGHVNVSVDSPVHIDSSAMTSEAWKKIIRSVEAAVHDPDVNGIVLMHGTDTLEETAFMLTLLFAPEKPIVMTGAMRPASALSADGPMNLYNAIKVALHERAPLGVSVLINDELFPGHSITKAHPTLVNAFTSPTGQKVGLMAAGEFVPNGDLQSPLTGMFSAHRERCLNAPVWARVPVVTSHVDDDGALIDALVAAKVPGFVYAGTGNGSVHEGAKASLLKAQAAGIIGIRASRVARGVVTPGNTLGQETGLLCAGPLTPWQARTFLQIALTSGVTRARLEQLINAR